MKRFVRSLHTRAPFRLLSIRAPRQAVLRTSSWLAPSVTNRSCDLPVKKTRNASNRCLPPNRTACTRTSCVPDSSRHFRSVDTPRSLRLRAVVIGGPDVSRRPKDRFGGPTMQHCARAPGLTTFGESRAWAFSSHGADAIEPLTPLSQPGLHPHASLGFPRAACFAVRLLLGGWYGSEDGSECQDHP
jgi:hypothetical protein